jgi:hypothetical protein
MVRVDVRAQSQCPSGHLAKIKNGTPSSMRCPSNQLAITPSGRPFSVSLGVADVGNCRRVCHRQPKIGIVFESTAAPTSSVRLASGLELLAQLNRLASEPGRPRGRDPPGE